MDWGENKPLKRYRSHRSIEHEQRFAAVSPVLTATNEGLSRGVPVAGGGCANWGGATVGGGGGGGGGCAAPAC